MTTLMLHDTRFAGISRRRAPAAAALAVACLLSAACGVTSGGASSYTLPGGWHDITPSSETLASYTISPDVHGLIVACIGAPGHVSAAPPGPGTLWRTRDGGAHWQQLNSDGYEATCQVAMPAGGHGLVFALNTLGTQMIRVSANGGDSWRTLNLSYSDEDGGMQAEFAQLAGAVYRDDMLYAAGVATGQGDNGASMSMFSASSDDGQTWRRIEAAPDPLLRQGYAVQAIAADYRAPGAWFRVIAPSYGAGNAPATLEHSSDGGVTWSVVDAFGPNGLYYGQGRATLVTSPAQPKRLCAGLEPDMITAQPNTSPSPEGSIQNDAHGGILAGPPYQPPRAVALLGSDDGGLHWSGATVSGNNQSNARMVPPGVAIDSYGGCYLAGTTSQFGSGDKNQYAAAIWRLAPGAPAPEVVVSLPQVGMSAFVVAPGSGGSGSQGERLVAEVLSISHTDTRTQSCGPGCTTIEYPGPDTPRLIWANAP